MAHSCGTCCHEVRGRMRGLRMTRSHRWTTRSPIAPDAQAQQIRPITPAHYLRASSERSWGLMEMPGAPGRETATGLPREGRWGTEGDARSGARAPDRHRNSCIPLHREGSGRRGRSRPYSAAEIRVRTCPHTEPHNRTLDERASHCPVPDRVGMMSPARSHGGRGGRGVRRRVTGLRPRPPLQPPYVRPGNDHPHDGRTASSRAHRTRS